MSTFLLISLLVVITAINLRQTILVQRELSRIQKQLEELIVRLHFLRLEYRNKHQ